VSQFIGQGRRGGCDKAVKKSDRIEGTKWEGEVAGLKGGER